MCVLPLSTEAIRVCKAATMRRMHNGASSASPAGKCCQRQSWSWSWPPLLQRSIAFHKRNHISQPKPRPTTTSNELQTTPANSSGCSQNASTLLSPFACLQSAIRTGGAASGGRIAAATTNNHQQQLTARNCNERTNARTNERTNERTSNCPRQQTAIRNRSIFIMENTVLLSYVYVD